MLTRQKILLSLLKAVGRPVNRLELMKWSFLLRHESKTQGGASFYEFLPYHCGPFSFSLYQEIGKLQDKGFVRKSDDNHWEIGEVAGPSPDRELENDAMLLAKKHAGKSVDNLLDEIYLKYPQYTVNSKRLQLAKRVVAAPAVYTSGYEGLSVDGFLNRLIESGVQQLVDVRRNPIARRFGFHKSTLKRLCESLDIAYFHLPELGITSDKRRWLETQDDYERLFDDYRQTTLESEAVAIASVTDLVKSKPSVLVCMEAKPQCCHRSHLAKVVSTYSNLQVKHLT
jgi:uncharacterized protein (DUF488 family)